MKKFHPSNIDDLKKIYRGRVVALTPVRVGKKLGAGIAVANEQGYSEIPLEFCQAEMIEGAWEALQDYLYELNQKHFFLSREASQNVVASTFFTPPTAH